MAFGGVALDCHELWSTSLVGGFKPIWKILVKYGSFLRVYYQQFHGNIILMAGLTSRETPSFSYGGSNFKPAVFNHPLLATNQVFFRECNCYLSVSSNKLNGWMSTPVCSSHLSFTQTWQEIIILHRHTLALITTSKLTVGHKQSTFKENSNIPLQHTPDTQSAVYEVNLFILFFLGTWGMF